LKLIVDENLPPKMANSLQALFAGEHTIVSMREKFGRTGVSDLEWIQDLGKEGDWSVLTADRRISRNNVEKQAFLSKDLVGFVMAPAIRKRPLTLQMARILQLWDTFDQQSQIVSRGLFEFSIRGAKLTQL